MTKLFKQEGYKRTSELEAICLNHTDQENLDISTIWSNELDSEYFLTYKQAKDRGGQVKKGETGFPVVFWQFGENEKTKDNGEKTVDKYCWCRYYTVFNVEQCDNVAYPKSPKAEELPPFNRIDNAECIYPNMPNKPLLVHKEQRAYYQPMHDMVNMPIPESFNIPEEYYSTLFHELTHSTMHPDRCGKRDENFIDKPSLNFGSQSYSKEELIAEMGASFLSGHCGFVDTTIEQSASYINGWLSRLRNDKKFIIQAAQQTQKAVDYILDRNNEETR